MTPPRLVGPVRIAASDYPARLAGFGLVLLRCSVINGLVFLIPRASEVSTSLGISGWVIVASLAAGCLTRTAAVATLVWTALLHVYARPLSAHFLASVVLMSGALALLGPGAYAADAWLFGRRVIRIASRPGTPRKGGRSPP